MRLLSDVAAHQGTTILCSLHQPRPQVFALLDRVLLMSRGQVSYFGTPAFTADYFASMGRPLSDGDSTGGNGKGSGGGGVGAVAVGAADAMLDVIGGAEISEDKRKKDGGEEGVLVVMPRAALLDQVRVCRGGRGSGGGGGNRAFWIIMLIL